MQYSKHILAGAFCGLLAALYWQGYCASKLSQRNPSSMSTPFTIRGNSTTLDFANIPCPTNAEIARYDADFHVDIDPHLRARQNYVPGDTPETSCDTQIIRTRVYQLLYLAEHLSLSSRAEYPAYITEALQTPYRFLKRNIRTIRFDAQNKDAGAYNLNRGDIYLSIRAVEFVKPMQALVVLLHEAKHSLSNDPGHVQCTLPERAITSRMNRCDNKLSLAANAGAYTLATIMSAEIARQASWLSDIDRNSCITDALSIITNSFNDSDAGLIAPTERIATLNSSHQLGWLHPYTSQFVMEATGISGNGISLRNSPFENTAMLLRNGKVYSYRLGEYPVPLQANTVPANVIDMTYVWSQQAIPFSTTYPWAIETQSPPNQRRRFNFFHFLSGFVERADDDKPPPPPLMPGGLTVAYLSANNQLSYFDLLQRNFVPAPITLGSLQAKRFLMGPDSLLFAINDRGQSFVYNVAQSNFRPSTFIDPNRGGAWISINRSLYRDFFLAVAADGIAYASRYQRNHHDLVPIRLDSIFPRLPERVQKVTEGFEGLLAVGKSGNLYYLSRGANSWKLLPVPGGATDAAFISSGKQIITHWTLDNTATALRNSFSQKCGATYSGFDVRTNSLLGTKGDILVLALVAANGYDVKYPCHEVVLPKRRNANIRSISYGQLSADGPRNFDQAVFIKVNWSDGASTAIKPYQ